ncbi:MAG: ABC transporter permease subunit [Treponema sp.]|nr:ABC transporter permease subunit [Treponema sp.]
MLKRILGNTLGISFYSLIAGFWPPIVLALMLNEVRGKLFKKTVQTVTYMPHFISTVVMAGMIILFLSPQSGGFIPFLMEVFGAEPTNLMYDAKYFKHIYVLSGIWQGIGWGSILYLAALAGIDEEIYEAAIIDGASRMQRIWHINIPGIMPTICIMLILSCGGIMNVGFEKVFLLMNDLNASGAEVISTYTYRIGLINRDFGFSTAVGLFNSVINFILLITVNTVIKKLGQASLI